jgi:ABC-type amino acid transport substrate-binding protein
VSRQRTTAALVALGILSATITACGSDDQGAAASGAPATTAQAKMTITVGSDMPYVPFEFGRPPYTGFDIDMIRDVGRRMNATIKVAKTPFDTIFRDLAQGRFDLVVSSVNITPEREKVVAFSIPYFNADQSLMVKKGSSIKTTADLAGKTVGVQLGGTGEAYAKDTLKSSKRKSYDIIGDAFNALASGQVDGVINDLPSSQYAQRKYPALTVVETIKTGQQYGIAYNKDDAELGVKVNAALRAMKADGSFDKIHNKWFGVDAPADLLS